MRRLNEAVDFGFTFTHPRWVAFWGLLISPSRGMLTNSPVLAFGFAGLGMALSRPKQDLLLTYIAVATLATILLYSTWSVWYAGNSFGYRFLVDLLPGLCLLMTLPWKWITAHRFVWSTFVTATAFSVAVQIVGVLYYPCDWYDKPVSATIYRDRLWDWKDPEVLRCLSAGPHLPWQ